MPLEPARAAVSSSDDDDDDGGGGASIPRLTRTGSAPRLGTLRADGATRAGPEESADAHTGEEARRGRTSAARRPPPAAEERSE